MDFFSHFGGLLAQVSPPAAPGTGLPTPVVEPATVPVIALKRWFGSLTLSSPEAVPDRLPLWAWLAGLGALLLLAIMAQGPRKALGQFLDVPGHARLLAASLGRLRRSGRLVAILLGATVVSWTAWQTPFHSRPERKEELGVLLKSKSRAELAVEQGELAALTPLRDVLGLGDMLVLTIGAAAVIFKFSADGWGRLEPSSRSSTTGWTTICWGTAGLYAMYRMAGLISDLNATPGTEGMPLGGCLFVEAAAVPLLMVLADGVLLAWVLVELRGPAAGDEDEGFDVAGTVRIVPAAILACLVGLPARYVATAAGLIVAYHWPDKVPVRPEIRVFAGGWGLAELQAGATAFVGLVGAVAWCRGSWWDAIKGYGRTLRAEGGHLAAVVAASGAAVGGVSALSYFLVLALPPQPWVLAAADSYAHYATLPIALAAVSAMIELSGRVEWPSAAKPEEFPGKLDDRAGMVISELEEV